MSFTPYPNIYSYFHKNPLQYEERTNIGRKVCYALALAACIWLMIMPGVVSITYSVIVRIAAGIGILGFGFAVWLGGKDYYDKKSGGKIKNLATKKFDSSYVTAEYILDCFEKNDFQAIAQAPQADNQPLQFEIHEDAAGRTFYCQVMNWFPGYKYGGLSEVKVIRDPEYTRVYESLKSIKNT